MGFLVVEGVFLFAREEDGNSEAMNLARRENQTQLVSDSLPLLAQREWRG
jgi:hypothetical protein